MSEWKEFLGDPSKGLIPAIRPSQLKMAECVDDIINNGGHAMIQAPCGVGKSLAYGVPAFLSDKRVVISTAKKNLQSQLLNKDLPNLAKFVKDIPYASLKGKANYACKLRHYEATDNSALDAEDQNLVNAFAEWIAADPSGDFSSFPAELPFEWLVSVKECLKLQCPYAADCGFLRTRMRADKAKVLVVNHSLLAYDLRLGGGKILGPYDVLIIDEAHQAPRFFEKAFSYEFTEKQAEQLERAFQSQWEIKISSNLRKAYHDFFSILERSQAGKFQLHSGNERALVSLAGALDELKQQCKSKGLMPDGSDDGVMESEGFDVAAGALGTNRAKSKVVGAAAQVTRLLEGCAILLGSYDDKVTEYVGFTEQQRDTVKLTVSPIEVGPLVAPALIHINKCIYTSATLTSGDGFNFFIREFGLSPNLVRIQENLPSPFDYRKHSVLYVSKEIPQPAKDRSNKDNILDAQAKEIHELLKASEGGAFVIAPSYGDLNALELRVDHLSDADRRPDGERYYHQTLQKSTNIDTLVSDFKSGWNNVLFGVKSISEGVDIPGLRLRLVIITGLCFPHYGDVLNKSRKDLFSQKLIDAGQPAGKAGMMAFDKIDVQLAGIELAQGAGRLIRTETDFGALVILDPRMHERAKNYSNALRRLLPHPPCNKKEEVVQILKAFRGLALKAEQAGK